MAVGRKKGTPRTGGRVKGTPNKATADIQAKLAALGCDPIEGMARIAAGKLTCIACDGRGEFPVTGDCQACGGTGREVVSIDTRARMYSELAQYIAPKRKAVEHSAEGGGPAFQTIINLGGPEK